MEGGLRGNPWIFCCQIVHDLGLATYPMMDRPGWLVHGLRKGGGSTRYLSRVDAEDGLKHTRLVGTAGAVPASSSPDVWRTPTMAVAADGRVAVIGEGDFVWEAELEAKIEAEVTVNFAMQGTGRVWTDDGAVDCTSSCSAKLPRGAVLRLRTDPGLPRDVLSATECIGYESVELGTCTVHVDADTEFTVSF